MKEIVVISGKGGTGKTSIVASFAALANNAVLADCDVDAADLHLVLEPDVKETHDFSGGKLASVITEKCTGCSRCEEVCNFDAAVFNGRLTMWSKEPTRLIPSHARVAVSAFTIVRLMQ